MMFVWFRITMMLLCAGTIDASGQGQARFAKMVGLFLSQPVTRLLLNRRLSCWPKAPDASGAPATGTHGGKIELIALDADKDDAAAVNDRVNLKTGAVLMFLAALIRCMRPMIIWSQRRRHWVEKCWFIPA